MRSSDLLYYKEYTPRLESYCYSNWLAILKSEMEKIKAIINVKEDTLGEY